MTFRSTLILGLVAAISYAAHPAAQGAENSFFRATSSSANTVAITDQPTWRRSDRVTTADIRFKKPDGIVFTDQDEPSAEKPAAKSAQPTSTAKSSVNAQAAAGTHSNSAFDIDRPAGKSPVALLPTTILPTIPTTQARQATNPIGPSPDATSASKMATLFPISKQKTADATLATTGPDASSSHATGQHTDDEVQLVARLLMDQGVMPTAQEEPLPGAPSNGRMNEPIPTARDSSGNEFAASGDCCYDDCACCPPQPCLFWVGGVEATFLVPDLNRQNATFGTERIDDEGSEWFSKQSEDIDSMYISPRIWLGVQGCRWGANLRYWHLRASEGSYDPSIGGFGTWDDYDCGKPDVGFFSCSSLDAYTVDLELTRRFCLNDCWMQAAIGVRHAELWNDDGITGLALTDEGLLNGFSRANRNSRGTGILLGLYGRKPLFPCSCVSWFYNARWSALWGSTQTSVETFASVQSTDPDYVASAASVNGAYTTVDDTMFIGEIQLGLEWDYCLCCLPANAFFRVAVEYQRWDGGQGFSASNSFAGITEMSDVDPTSIVSTSAISDEPQLDLLGFTIGTGLTW
jgi:hypothetical protein